MYIAHIKEYVSSSKYSEDDKIRYIIKKMGETKRSHDGRVVYHILDSYNLHYIGMIPKTETCDALTNGYECECMYCDLVGGWIVDQSKLGVLECEVKSVHLDSYYTTDDTVLNVQVRSCGISDDLESSIEGIIKYDVAESYWDDLNVTDWASYKFGDLDGDYLTYCTGVMHVCIIYTPLLEIEPSEVETVLKEKGKFIYIQLSQDGYTIDYIGTDTDRFTGGKAIITKWLSDEQ